MQGRGARTLLWIPGPLQIPQKGTPVVPPAPLSKALPPGVGPRDHCAITLPLTSLVGRKVKGFSLGFVANLWRTVELARVWPGSPKDCLSPGVARNLSVWRAPPPLRSAALTCPQVPSRPCSSLSSAAFPHGAVSGSLCSLGRGCFHRLPCPPSRWCGLLRLALMSDFLAPSAPEECCLRVGAAVGEGQLPGRPTGCRPSCAGHRPPPPTQQQTGALPAALAKGRNK